MVVGQRYGRVGFSTAVRGEVYRTSYRTHKCHGTKGGLWCLDQCALLQKERMKMHNQKPFTDGGPPSSRMMHSELRVLPVATPSCLMHCCIERVLAHPIAIWMARAPRRFERCERGERLRADAIATSTSYHPSTRFVRCVSPVARLPRSLWAPRFRVTSVILCGRSAGHRPDTILITERFR